MTIDTGAIEAEKARSKMTEKKNSSWFGNLTAKAKQRVKENWEDYKKFNKEKRKAYRKERLKVARKEGREKARKSKGAFGYSLGSNLMKGNMPGDNMPRPIQEKKQKSNMEKLMGL